MSDFKVLPASSLLEGEIISLINNPSRDYDCTYQYDLNGNLTSLTRKGVSTALSTMGMAFWAYGTVDDLTLSYSGNQLKKVSDRCAALTYEGAMDFRDGVDKATEYQWDANGNLTRDRNKGIHTVCYNVLNLPQEILFGDSHIIRYKYAADGRKLQTEYVVSPVTVLWDDIEPGGPLDPMDGRARVRSRDGIGGGEYFPVETTLMRRDYCGDVIYRDGQLERIMSEYGYWAGGQWHYYINDYQGNVRAVIDHAGTLLETNSYYPYGGLQGGTAGVQPYKYGAKELDRQRGLDWYDSQARMYDPLIGRTPTQDPLLEKYYPIGPYAWCAANPVLYVDRFGEKLEFAAGSTSDFYINYAIAYTYLAKHGASKMIELL